MTLGHSAVLAVQNQDAYTAGAIADRLRFRYGLRYSDVYRFVINAHRRRGIDPPDLPTWEALLYEADRPKP